MRTLHALLAAVALGTAACTAGAGQLGSRGQLSAILQPYEVVETFEGKVALPPGPLYHHTGLLNFENNLWITRLGVHYYSPLFILDEVDGVSHALGDAASTRAITIDYVYPTIAMGVDLRAAPGACANGTVSLYRTTTLLAEVRVGAPQFFGWSQDGGVSVVTFRADEGCRLFLDNHTYAWPAPAIPAMSPSGAVLLAVLVAALAACALRRRLRPRACR